MARPKLRINHPEETQLQTQVARLETELAEAQGENIATELNMTSNLLWLKSHKDKVKIRFGFFFSFTDPFHFNPAKHTGFLI